jgi:hypothetical protein
MQNEFDKQSSLESTSEVSGGFAHTHTHTHTLSSSQAKPNNFPPKSYTDAKKSQPSEAEATKKKSPKKVLNK